MNQIYILGALALTQIHAKVKILPTDGASLDPVAGMATNVLNTDGLGGTYTYSYTGDCLSSGALTNLGLNNNYYQYYYTQLSKGTATYSSTATIYKYFDGGAIIFSSSQNLITNTYYGCYHMHIYNWLTMPSLVTTTALTSVTSGFASAVFGYGYAMTGTTTTSCSVSSIVTTILFLTNKFYGAQYQSSILTITTAGTIQAIVPIPVWGTQGPGYYATKTATTITAGLDKIGFAFTTSQNSYWDFMQSNTIQGMTTLGRGGGLLGTGPCGWYVGYFYEAPARGISHSTDTFNQQDDAAAPTLNFWTDTSVIQAASALVIASLAGLVFL